VGEYFSDKLVNIGANRWAFKPELGVSYPIGRWYLDAYAGVWLFTDNDAFFGGAKREQDPLASYQVHVSYAFRPRLWIAFDATYYTGGRTTVDGTRNADTQSNSRLGLTMSLPIGRSQSLKFNWSEGATTRIGGDFTTVGIAWQWAWFD
jgi:predicted porin